jgi:hypothetical protein
MIVFGWLWGPDRVAGKSCQGEATKRREGAPERWGRGKWQGGGNARDMAKKFTDLSPLIDLAQGVTRLIGSYLARIVVARILSSSVSTARLVSLSRLL